MSTDRFREIKESIIRHAEHDEDIRAIVAIGSSARVDVKADEYSDLDLIVVTEDPETWYSGEYPDRFGKRSISFIETTLGGIREIRSIYDEDKDVDLVVFTPEEFQSAVESGVADWVMNRGYTVLYDSLDMTSLLERHVESIVSRPEMSEAQFVNIVNDFYFHNIWAMKKLLRGELWTAKMCVDCYLKRYLLQMIELYCGRVRGTDVWHDGRFLDHWAEGWILDELDQCFAHYDKADLKDALLQTHALFAKLTQKTAAALGYDYPNQAEDCARAFLIPRNS